MHNLHDNCGVTTTEVHKRSACEGERARETSSEVVYSPLPKR